MRLLDPGSNDQEIDKQAKAKQQRSNHGHGRVGRHPRGGYDRPCGVHGEHEKLAMGKIDDLQNAKDQGEADRHDGVDAAQHDAGDEQLQDRAHRPRRRPFTLAPKVSASTNPATGPLRSRWWPDSLDRLVERPGSAIAKRQSRSGCSDLHPSVRSTNRNWRISDRCH